MKPNPSTNPQSLSTITTVILDWAGTTIDYGSFAPVEAFLTAFGSVGLHPSVDEVRAYMGMQKRAHIAKMLEPYPHQPEDVDTIYARFEPALFDVLELYTDPLPGVITTVGELGEMGLSVGSTTGYTQAMMDVVLPLAKKKGYAPDCLVCPDDVGNTGRPFPYMLWRNLEKLGTRCISEVIKVGDTIADIQEGNNAGCLSVGVLEGSSVVGLTSSEVAQLGPGDLLPVFTKAEQLFFEAGADYVLRNITELPSLITSLHQSLEA